MAAQSLTIKNTVSTMQYGVSLALRATYRLGI